MGGSTNQQSDQAQQLGRAQANACPTSLAASGLPGFG